ncbi:MAG: acyltransferase, partial [Bacteroidales bacterium]|nr:acyltransferase [Bacteroidales bacterium]
MIKVFRNLRHLFLIKVIWRRYKFGKNVYIGRSVSVWARNFITVGDNFYIGKYSQIECDAIIGNDVMFANYVALVG